MNVGVSSVDIQMRNVQAYSRGNQYLIQAEVFNASVTTVGALTFALQSGTQLNVQEEWAGEIKPRQSIIYLFKTQLESRFAEQLRYLCINAFPPEEINEVTLADNRSCIALQNDFSILNVYPNPIHREGTVTCILPANHPVILEVFDAQGKNIIRFVEDYTQEGINELPLNMTMLPYGIYEIRLTYQGQVRSRRVLRVED